MNKIKNIFSNRSTLTFVLGALFVLLFLRQCNQTQSLKRDLELAKQESNRNFNNYLASKDTIRNTKSENGDLIAEIRSYEIDVNNFLENKVVCIFSGILTLKSNISLTIFKKDGKEVFIESLS
mgnify:CR=1 FL=1